MSASPPKTSRIAGLFAANNAAMRSSLAKSSSRLSRSLSAPSPAAAARSCSDRSRWSFLSSSSSSRHFASRSSAICANIHIKDRHSHRPFENKSKETNRGGRGVALLVLESLALLVQPGVELSERPVGYRARRNLRRYRIRASSPSLASLRSNLCGFLLGCEKPSGGVGGGGSFVVLGAVLSAQRVAGGS